MRDEPPLTSKSQDKVTMNALIAVASFALAAFAASYGTKALSRGPGRQAGIFGAAGEVWAVYGRMSSQLQRADHVEFFENGNTLAISCPRYSKITLWDTSVPFSFPPAMKAVVNLEGRPVGLTPLGDRIVVLQRPPGDDRHVKPGFYEVFDRKGERAGSPVEVGWEPDQIEFVERDGLMFALILFSGSAEGESNRGAPSLMVATFDPDKLTFEKRSQVDFETDGEDPLHFMPVVETAGGKPAAKAIVSFGRKPGAVWVDWTDPAAAKVTARHGWPQGSGEPSRYELDTARRRVLAIPADLAASAAAFPLDGTAPEPVSIAFPSQAGENYLNEPDQRFLAIDHEKGTIGRFGTRQGVLLTITLKGPYGFGSVRLTDFAVHESPGRKSRKVAVIDRSGGLHWLTGGLLGKAAPPAGQTAAANGQKP